MRAPTACRGRPDVRRCLCGHRAGTCAHPPDVTCPWSTSARTGTGTAPPAAPRPPAHRAVPGRAPARSGRSGHADERLVQRRLAFGPPGRDHLVARPEDRVAADRLGHVVAHDRHDRTALRQLQLARVPADRRGGSSSWASMSSKSPDRGARWSSSWTGMSCSIEPRIIRVGRDDLVHAEVLEERLVLRVVDAGDRLAAPRSGASPSGR